MTKPDGELEGNKAAKSEHHGSSQDWEEYYRERSIADAEARAEAAELPDRQGSVSYAQSQHPAVRAEREQEADDRPPLTEEDDQRAYQAFQNVRKLLRMRKMPADVAAKMLRERS